MESKFVLFVVLVISAQGFSAAVDGHAQLQALKERSRSEFKALISGLFEKIRNDLLHPAPGNNSVTENEALIVEAAKNKSFDQMSNGWEALIRGLVVIWPEASSDVDALMAEIRPRFRTESIGSIHRVHELSKKNVSPDTRTQIQTMEAEGLSAAEDITVRTFDLIRKYAIGTSSVGVLINTATKEPIDIALREAIKITRVVYHTPYQVILASLDIQLPGSKTTTQDVLVEITNNHAIANNCVDNFVETIFLLYETLYRLKPTNLIGNVVNLNLLGL